MYCPICSEPVPENIPECPNCGAVLGKLSPQLPICPKCGTQNPLEARFCHQCGETLTEQSAEELPETAGISESSVVQLVSSVKRTEPGQSKPEVNIPTQKQAFKSVPRIKATPVIIALGGITGLFCLCLLAVVVLGYSTIRSWVASPVESTLPQVENSTQPVFISPSKTNLPATKRPTVAASLTFTVFPTNTKPPTFTPRPTATATSSLPFGKIVFSCQMDGENHDQICIINADGTGWRQLTDNGKHNWYASISPDGQSVIYSSNIAGNNYEIYEISVRGGNIIQLTSHLGGKLYAPEISPDGKKIAFTHDDGGFQSVWVMNRDGSNPHRVSPDDGWDPSWSADGKLILFGSLTADGTVQLFTMNESGANVKQVTNRSGLIGRSDLSPSGEYIATYAGKYGARSIYLIPLNGSTSIKYFFPPTSSAPSFSPDGQWMAFTGYIDHQADLENGCEIYMVRLDDPKDIIRLTDNNYCDWQPRWGP